jgi:GT2 family glycosyltransferase
MSIKTLTVEQDSRCQPGVDVVIPVYGERSEALAATLSACVKQSYPIARIFIVDDGSPDPVSLPDWAQSSAQTILVRLSENLGISSARNAAIARSNAPLLACINTEVLPDPAWLASCVDYLLTHPSVGACYTRLISATPHRILTRWRMRFLETKFGEQSGPTEFAPGHAVLFRKEALDLVGGYDAGHRFHHEDSDICKRMRESGWATHYLAESQCMSIQKDNLKQLAAKELRESYWYSPPRVHCSIFTFISANGHSSERPETS